MENLLFLDTETTGNEPKDYLCQVCYSYQGEIADELFKPQIPISIESMAVHHITNKMILNKPNFKESDMYGKLATILKKENTIFVAHNAKFDIGMLEKEGLSVPSFICTLRVTRALDTKNQIPRYNLQYLRYYLEMEIEATAHDAKGDVLVLMELFKRLLDKIKESGKTQDEALAEMIAISKQPSLMNFFTFGKYNGKEVREVAQIDPGYLEWMLAQKESSTTDEEDWIYTLRHYLGK